MSWIDDVMAARAAGSFDGAMSVLQRELALRPNDPVVHYQIAWTHDALGRETDAFLAYERALALGLSGDDRCGAYLGLGSTFRTIGEYQRSADVFARACAEFPDHRALRVFHALTLYNLGRPAASIEILLRELAETSNDASIQRYQKALLFYSDKLDQTFA